MKKPARVALVRLLCGFVVVMGCGAPTEENSEVDSVAQQVTGIGPYYPPVVWKWWATGQIASAHGTVACGDPTDPDVYLRYDHITGAYTKPDSLSFETNNSLIPLGLWAAFGSSKVEAFRIDPDDTVHICVGAKFAAVYNFTQEYLAYNLALSVR